MTEPHDFGSLIVDIDELEARLDAELRARRSVRQPAYHDCDCEVHYADNEWHGWDLCAKYFRLVRDGGYDLDLEKATSSAKVLDWIMQVSHKAWNANAKDKSYVLGLVDAVDALLDPQSTLCSFGTGKRLNKKAIRQRIAAVVAAWPLEPF